MKGLVYVIKSKQTTDIYFGSTIQTQQSRMKEHKTQYKVYIVTQKKYISSYEILKFDDAYMEILEEIEWDIKKELIQKLKVREGHYIQRLPCVNIYVPARTPKQWAIDNKAKQSLRRKQHYQDHIEEEKLKNKKQYEDHKEERIEKQKKYHSEHLEQDKARNNQYRLEHLEQIKIANKKYREEHRVELIEHSRQYRIDHKEELKQKRQENKELIKKYQDI